MSSPAYPPAALTPAILLGVRDRGIGIAAEVLQSLFNRYERYEKTPGKIAGTGLGPAIARPTKA